MGYAAHNAKPSAVSFASAKSFYNPDAILTKCYTCFCIVEAFAKFWENLSKYPK